jgi:hypothetical protein
MGSSTNRSLTQRFLQIEDEYNVFDIKPEGVPIWERIRFNLHRQIKQQATDYGQAHTKTAFTKETYGRGVQLWAKNAIYKNPYFAGNHDILFYGHSRRKLNTEGLWEDIYCDPIYEESDINYLHIEEPYLMDHKTPAKTENLRYIEFIHYTGAIRRNLGLSKVTITGTIRERLMEVNQALEAEFDVDIDIVTQAEKKLTRRDSILDLYKLFLRRVNPKIAVVVVSYGKHTFLEACHELGIPTVELQHGGFEPNHIGYAFPGDRSKETFPDYLFTFGDFWKERVKFSIPDENIYPVGYPYLEKQKEIYSSIKSEDSVLFISQGPIGEKLTKFAVEYAQLEDKYEVMIKLHPGEYDRWKESYPWLVDAPVTVIDGDEPPLYKLLATASVQVGVTSTVIYVGLSLGMKLISSIMIHLCRLNIW